MEEIFKIEELSELERFLKNKHTDEFREHLFQEFLKYSNYKNATEWNRAVKICECFAIIGWGKYEALQASKGQFFNGNPNTKFYNKFYELRFVDAIWSKRKSGYTMEQGRTSYFQSPDDSANSSNLWNHKVVEDIQDLKLVNQRNWIPFNPILIKRSIGNCYENSKLFIERFEKELQPELDRKMKPESYGRAVNQLVFNCSFSFYDNYHCKTNYVIADENLKLKKKDFRVELSKMFSKKEIDDNGYYLRNRFEFGPFQSKTGRMKTNINFEKEFSELSFIDHKITFSKHLIKALKVVIAKLKKKKLEYDFDLMFDDFQTIINTWLLVD